MKQGTNESSEVLELAPLGVGRMFISHPLQSQTSDIQKEYGDKGRDSFPDNYVKAHLSSSAGIALRWSALDSIRKEARGLCNIDWGQNIEPRFPQKRYDECLKSRVE